MRDAERDAAATFDSSELSLAQSLGSLAIAGSVLLLGVAAWRWHSALVGAAYTVVGAFFVSLPVIIRLPEPIPDAVRQIYFWSAGPLNAVGTIGAAMLLIGVVVIGRSIQGRSAGRVSEPRAGIDTRSIHP
jgi:hypothetical protein